MDSVKILVLIVDVVFVKADVQLTQYAIRDHYNDHDCMQLLPCDHLETLGVQKISECVLQAMHAGTDMFIYEKKNDSCQLCLQTNMNSGIAEVHSSQFVYVKGMKIYVI